MQNILIAIIIVILVMGGIVGFMLTQLEPTAESVVTEPVVVVEEEVVNDPSAETTPPASADESVPTEPDITATVGTTPELSTLMTALIEAELAGRLQDTGPFTVFAPTNDAFAALPAETLETLLLPENMTDLQGILSYHIVPGAIQSSDLTDGMEIETLNGQTITISIDSNGVSVNGSANVSMADNVTTNGIVHIVDAVLLPEDEGIE